ncbi:phosphohistidine phosphatase SixA [bacterium]|nr:phosphohistidine phosphatase SixA [bacterium]
MKLYFLRHGSAADIATSDAARELTKEGREEARIAGTALVALQVKPDRIASSPLVRARQTAEHAAQVLGFSGSIEVLPELANDSSLSSLLRAVKALGPAEELLLVGHMPSLAEHVGALISKSSDAGVEFGKGTVACIELEVLHAGAGALRWLMRQKQLRILAG